MNKLWREKVCGWTVCLLALLTLISWIVVNPPFNGSSNKHHHASHCYSPAGVLNQDAGAPIRECIDCARVVKSCSLTPTLKSRYQHLQKDKHYLFALALHNSQPLIRNMVVQLSQVFEFLGVNHTTLSIYEGGSSDNSSQLLSLLALEFEMIGVTTHVVTGGPPIDWEHVYRIEALAKVRNRVLEPLFEDVDRVNRLHSPPAFHSIVYLNDIVFCAADILELIHQHTVLGASMVCPLDFGTWDPFLTPFYDLWVARTMAGDILYDAFGNYEDGGANVSLSRSEQKWKRETSWHASNGLQLFWKDRLGQARASQGRPVQVYSCWNGGVVIDPRPFYESRLQFRRGKKGECAESECSHFSKDLWQAGYGKIAIVPSVAVAYTFEEYERVRTRWELLMDVKGRMIPFFAPKLQPDCGGGAT